MTESKKQKMCKNKIEKRNIQVILSEYCVSVASKGKMATQLSLLKLRKSDDERKT